MIIPFVFGRIATGSEFTNREKETARLQTNFEHGINTILISPRRWGKSSLVAHAARRSARSNKKLRFCFVDLYNVRSEEEFYNAYATAVLGTMSTKTEELVRLAGKFLGRLIPRLTFNPGGGASFSLGLDWKEAIKSPDEILNLGERLATEKKLRLIICLDEFQQVAGFSDPISFQKKLRAHWQTHAQVSYCLYGSKRHMMLDVFTNSRMPFYKFGDIIYLEKIAVNYWKKYIVSRFSATGKKINATDAALVANLADEHPYYVQQLAQMSWLHTKDKPCTSIEIEEAYDSLLRQLGMIFQSMTDSLSATQVRFLEAVLDKEPQPSSAASLKKYQLGTSANVNRIKQALENREILDFTGEVPEFSDPMYKGWLRRYYFRMEGDLTLPH